VNQNRRLYRCRDDRRIAGVAAGVAEFFDLDPSIVRVVWFVSIFFGGLSLFLYIAMALIVPLEPLSDVMPAEAIGDAGSVTADGPVAAYMGHRHAPRQPGRWGLFFGYALILLGGIALADTLLPAFDAWHYLWPALIIGLGVLLVAGALRRESIQS
jgi:phage shock protein C